MTRLLQGDRVLLITVQDNISKPVPKNYVSILAPTGIAEPPPRKLLDRASDTIRVKHYF